MMRTAAACLAVSLLLPGSAAWALDPGRAPSQYVVRTWGATSLRSNTVHAVLQSGGYLWLGTSAGVVRYDGARFVVFGAAATPDFGEGGVSALAEGPQGTLYLGTTSGVVMERGPLGFKRLFALDRAGLAHSILAARDGGVWMAFDDQPPMQRKDGKVERYLAQTRTLSPRAIAQAPDGAIWIGTRDGLLRVEGREFTPSPLTHDSVQALRFTRDGALWIGTPHGLYRFKDGDTRHFTQRDGLPHDHVSAILEDRDGNMWVGTDGGLGRLTDGRFTALTFAHGLADDDVRCLLEDDEGTLWVGTGNGLSSVSDGGFVTYGRAEGLADDKVTAVLGASDGATWVGTVSGQLSRIDGARVETFTLPGGVGRQAVVALYETHAGALFIATENGRLFERAGGTLRERTPAGAAGRQRVTCLFEDEGGLALFVTGPDVGRGLVRLEGGRFVPFTRDYPPLGYVHAAERDGHGTFWLATTQGLVSLASPATRFQKDLPQRRVRSTSVDEGGLWLATAGGLAYFEEGNVRALTVKEGLPENYLRVVLDDGLGHLWAAGLGTLFRLDKREARSVLEKKLARVSPVVFDTSDGLRTNEALLGNNPAFRAADGRLWFATAKGVSVVDPRALATDDPAPEARVEAVTVDGRAEVLPEYAPGRGELTVEYRAGTLSERTRFRHRLEGFDADWVDAGDGRRAYYSSLPAGRYRFVVEASNRHGRFNGAGAAFAFRLRPPFYRTPLFYGLCLAFLAGTAAGVHRFRLRRVQARFAAVLGERTRIARELHDTLAQGVAGIRLQIETGLGAMASDPGAAREHFELAGAMARSSIAEVRRSIWVLRAQTSKGKDGLAVSLTESLRHLTAGSPLQPAIEISGEAQTLPADLEHNLLRITHEVVLNALRHSGARTLTVALRFGADAVQLDVKDDGCGFDVDAHLARSGATHFGLLGMVERAAALGGRLELRRGPTGGTEVACRLPYDGGSMQEPVS
jgi:signal transduction histidine kinase/ligand-binding sensor domain-containing protein